MEVSKQNKLDNLMPPRPKEGKVRLFGTSVKGGGF
jgi:hypothetical protein